MSTRLPPAQRPLPPPPEGEEQRPSTDPGTGSNPRERRGSKGQVTLPTIGGAQTPENGLPAGMAAPGGSGRRPGSGGARSVLRECNWVVSSPMPSRPARPGSGGGGGGTGGPGPAENVGAYLRALARREDDAGAAFLAEMNAVGEEVRLLQRQKAEADGAKHSMRARMLELEEELTEVMAQRVQDMESNGNSKQLESGAGPHSPPSRPTPPQQLPHVGRRAQRF
eukprot:SAG22_NODE_155_length_17123_cov_37.528489_7_plen_224_part_00